MTAVISAYIFKKLIKMGKFCVTILILKIEEKKEHFQHIMLYYLKKRKNTTETQKKICAVCGDAVTEQMCLKWFVKFSVEDMLDDAPWSSRPVEIDSYQTETLIENSQLIPCKRLLTHSKYPVLKIICSSLVIFMALMFGFHISRENLDYYLHMRFST